MTQTTAIAPTSLHVCRLRVTRLTAAGAVSGSTKNSYVTGNPIQLQITPDVLAGTQTDLVGGCDCIVVTYQGYNKRRRFNLQLQMGAMEVPLMEMLLGATLISDASTVPTPIGIQYPNQVSCTVPQQPNVALEAWTDNWQNDAQSASPFRYTHWLFPSTYWQQDAVTLENNFALPQFTSFTRTNPAWGTGPYMSDPAPVAITSDAAFWYTDTLPTVAITYATVA